MFRGLLVFLVSQFAILCSALPAFAGPHDVAIIIGNKNYSHPSVPDVDYAHNDAKAFRNAALKVFKVPEGNVVLVTDATLGKFNALFGRSSPKRSRLANLVRHPDAKIYIFYSGHGVPVIPSPGARAEPYLLSVSAAASEAQDDGYSLKKLRRHLLQVQKEKAPKGKVFMFLDACFSGDSGAGRLVEKTSAVGVAIDPSELKEEASEEDRLVVVSAARGHQVANWDTERKLGIFTDQLVWGLFEFGDTRDGNGDKQLSLTELRSYLNRAVAARVRKLYGGTRVQTPDVAGSDKTLIAKYNGAYPVRDFGLRARERARCRGLRILPDPGEIKRFLATCQYCPCRAELTKIVGASGGGNGAGSCAAMQPEWERIRATNNVETVRRFADIVDCASIKRAALNWIAEREAACQSEQVQFEALKQLNNRTVLRQFANTATCPAVKKAILAMLSDADVSCRAEKPIWDFYKKQNNVALFKLYLKSAKCARYRAEAEAKIADVEGAAERKAAAARKAKEEAERKRKAEIARKERQEAERKRKAAEAESRRLAARCAIEWETMATFKDPAILKTYAGRTKCEVNRAKALKLIASLAAADKRKRAAKCAEEWKSASALKTGESLRAFAKSTACAQNRKKATRLALLADKEAERRKKAKAEAERKRRELECRVEWRPMAKSTNPLVLKEFAKFAQCADNKKKALARVAKLEAGSRKARDAACREEWKKAAGLTTPDSLRAFARGTSCADNKSRALAMATKLADEARTKTAEKARACDQEWERVSRFRSANLLRRFAGRTDCKENERRALALAEKLEKAKEGGSRGVFAKFSETAIEAWRGLASMSSVSCSDMGLQADHVDGLQSAYCSVRGFASISTLETMAGVPFYLDGPHSGDRLTLRSERTFGRYNPKMISWIRRNLIPTKDDTAYLTVTRPLYERYVAKMARAYYVTYVKWTHNFDYFKEQRQMVVEVIEGRRAPFYDPLQDEDLVSRFDLDIKREGLDWHHVDTALRYWKRRSIDGTASLVFAALEDLIEVYDPDYLATAQRPNPSSPKLENVVLPLGGGSAGALAAILRKQLGVNAFDQLSGATLCVLIDAAENSRVEAAFIKANLTFTPLKLAGTHDVANALQNGECDVFVAHRTHIERDILGGGGSVSLLPRADFVVLEVPESGTGSPAVAPPAPPTAPTTPGYLGVNIWDIDDELIKALNAQELVRKYLPSRQGAIIMHIDPQGPLAGTKAGTGDVITRMNGELVSNTADVARIVRKTGAGKPLWMSLIGDNGVTKRVDIVLASRSDDARERLIDGYLKSICATAANFSQQGNHAGAGYLLRRCFEGLALVDDYTSRLDGALPHIRKLGWSTRKELQAQLKDAGYYKGKLDGELGPNSRRAILAFIESRRPSADAESDTGAGGSAGTGSLAGMTPPTYTGDRGTFADWKAGSYNSGGKTVCYAYSLAKSVSPSGWRTEIPTFHIDVEAGANAVAHRIDYTKFYRPLSGADKFVTTVLSSAGLKKVPAIDFGGDIRMLEPCGNDKKNWCVSNVALRAVTSGRELKIQGLTADGGKATIVTYSLRGYADAVNAMNGYCNNQSKTGWLIAR